MLADKGLIPTSAIIDTGVYRDIEPVREFDYRNKEALLAALQEIVATGNPQILGPQGNYEAPKTPMEVIAKAKSWADLERKSIYFSLDCYPSEYSVKSWGRAANGTWGEEDNLALDIRVPVDKGLKAVADAIINHLGTRRDLPGLMSASA